jgi:glyoxylase-like metal-dependent hydrolase (beta-lactamase superfamily II)
MKRELILGMLIVAGGLAIAAAAQQAPAPAPSAAAIEVNKLKDNLFVLSGGGGNTSVFVQANGVTVVDTKNPGWGQPVLTKIRELTNKPVTMIINTHTHGDHVSGNVDFPATVDVVVQEKTAARMKSMPIFTKSGGVGLPKRTFGDSMTLGSGNDRIDLHYFGRGHTDGDAWVLFPALRVMAAGDIFSGKNIPYLDYTNGASGVEIPDTLMKAYTATAKGVDSIVTGHSTVMTPADLREYVDFNRDFLNAVREAKKSGRSAEEFIKSWTLPAKYKGYAPTSARLQGNVEGMYKEIQ